MTNKKALKILKSIEILAFRDKKQKYFMKDVRTAQKVAIRTLEQATWIPLNKKGFEPKKNGKYLACFDDGYITDLYYENGEWLIDNHYPIAWMTLPQPYI